MPRASRPTKASPSPAAEKPWPGRWLAPLIFAAVLVAYWPALQGDFVWDDDRHVTRPELRSASGLARIWSEVGATQQYYPLLHTAFWLEHRLWGDAAPGYHAVNIILHATAALLFAFVLSRLGVPGAALAALLFALHPVCVESVAWISEQKNTLSAVFYLGAALAYLRFDAERRPGAYVLALVLFVAALLTKTVTATLPAALLLVFWWRRGRLSWRRDVRPLAPWFAAGVIAGLFTAWVERTQIGAEGAEFALTSPERLLVAGRAVWFYLGKLVWPAELTFIYPRWDVTASAGWQWAFPVAVLLVLAGLLVASRRHRGPLAAALFFGGTLFPALGFFNVYPFLYSYVADHFQYLAGLGVLALVAAVLVRAFDRRPAWIGRTLAVGLLAGLGVLTWRQSRIYRDDFTLYRATLQRNPECWMAHNNLARALAAEGRLPEAVAHLEAALRLRPDYPEALTNLGDSLVRMGRPLEAISHLERALQLRADFGEELHNSLGLALIAAGRPADGVAHLQRALELRPDYAVGHFNLGLALANQGRLAEAEAHLEMALRLQADFPEAHYVYGRILARSGRSAEAIARFQEALRLRPDYSDARRGLEQALRQVR